MFRIGVCALFQGCVQIGVSLSGRLGLVEDGLSVPVAPLAEFPAVQWFPRKSHGSAPDLGLSKWTPVSKGDQKETSQLFCFVGGKGPLIARTLFDSAHLGETNKLSVPQSCVRGAGCSSSQLPCDSGQLVTKRKIGCLNNLV